MPTSTNTLLSLILGALGILGVILSFMIVDRKKYLISLTLSIVVIVTGIVQLSQTSIRNYQVSRRMKQIRDEQQMTINQMQEQLKTRAQEGVGTQTPAPKKP